MKLKKAKKLAKMLGFNWIAVDPNKDIYGYIGKPEVITIMGQPEWIVKELADTSCRLLGTYSGIKFWNKTLRRVK